MSRNQIRSRIVVPAALLLVALAAGPAAAESQPGQGAPRTTGQHATCRLPSAQAFRCDEHAAQRSSAPAWAAYPAGHRAGASTAWLAGDLRVREDERPAPGPAQLTLVRKQVVPVDDNGVEPVQVGLGVVAGIAGASAVGFVLTRRRARPSPV